MGQKLHIDTPAFNDDIIQIGGKPIQFPHWQKCGIHSLSDRLFQDQRDVFNVPGSSFLSCSCLCALLCAQMGFPEINHYPLTDFEK